MKIELKAIKFSASQSEETNAFTADVYINGKKAAHARNSGKGGSTGIRAYEGFTDILNEAFEFAKTLPMVEDLKMDLEFYLDLQLDEFLKKKFEKQEATKIKKLMLTSVVFKTKDGNTSYISYRRFTIKDIMGLESGRKSLRELVSKLKSEGSTILNTNIDEILK